MNPPDAFGATEASKFSLKLCFSASPEAFQSCSSWTQGYQPTSHLSFTVHLENQDLLCQQAIHRHALTAQNLFCIEQMVALPFLQNIRKKKCCYCLHHYLVPLPLSTAAKWWICSPRLGSCRFNSFLCLRGYKLFFQVSALITSQYTNSYGNIICRSLCHSSQSKCCNLDQKEEKRAWLETRTQVPPLQ